MKEIRTIYANKGVEVRYRRELNALIGAMNASALYWLLAGYGEKTPSQIEKELRKRIKQWQKTFNKQSKIISKRFISEMRKYIETNMRLALLEKGINAKTDTPEKVVKGFEIENENLIRSIPEKYFAQVATLALLAVNYGWDSADLTNKINIHYNKTIKRAKLIADDQAHKACEMFKLAICEGLGITKGKWVYTFRSKEPRHSHVNADGQIFWLHRGCWIDEEFVYPAEKINCKCSFSPIIVEVGDNAGV